MKTKKLIPMLMIIPLLASCGKKDLVIPAVDVDSIVPVLPARPQYNTGAIKTDGENDYIDIYELSDFHGAVNEGDDELGLAKLAGYLDIKRADNAGGTVVVSSGDMFQGSADSNLTRGYMVNYSMNYMGFDSMAIGNHEFDWTDTWLKKNANLAYNDHKIPYISANIVNKSTNQTPDYLSKSTIIERNGYKIGIVGSIGESLKSSIMKTCVENYEFTNEVEAVNAEAKKLKEVDNCNIVIWTSHNGIANNAGLSSVSNVDAIFGGHSHTNEKVMVNNVPAVQTENYGSSVAHIQLKINQQTKAVSCSEYAVDEVPLTLSGLKANENIKTIMNNYTAKIDDIKNIKLGKAPNDLKITGALKNVCVESMYQGALKGIKENKLEIPEDKIVATFHNVEGGIRKDIAKGEIKYREVYASFPFDNEIVLYKIKGQVIKDNMKNFSEYAVRRTFDEASELKSEEEYYICLTDFLALSSKYFAKFLLISEDSLIRTGKIVREEVADFVYKKDEIKTQDFASGKLPYKPIMII